MKTDYLVCYDIKDSRRLGRVLRFMKGQGEHLQYSVFRCSLTWPELNKLKERLGELIDIRSDDVRIYPLTEKSLVAVLGRGDRTPEGVEVFL